MKAGLRGGLLASAMAVLSFLPAHAETLADALASAYRNSNLLEQNRAVLRAADEDVAAAVAALRPVVSWVAALDYTDSPSGDSLDATLSLAAGWTVYDFGRNRLQIEATKQVVLATRDALVQVEQQVLLAAVAAYMDVRNAVENLAITQNSVKVIGEELKAAQDRFSVGEVTRTDVALAEARLASARASLAAAQGSLASAREAYRAATGAYPGSLAVPPRAPDLPASVDEAQAIAQRIHPSIRRAQEAAKAADIGVEIAAAERRPSLDMTASVSRLEGGENSARIGLEMSQVIYSGGALPSLHRRAIATRDAARSELLQTGVLVAQNVGNSWAQIDVARAQITATQLQVEAATIAYEGVREEAKLGARTTLDVLDTEQDLLDAKAARINAQTQLQVATYSLLASMGLLTAEHLKLGVPAYDPEAYYNAVKAAPHTSVQGKSLDRVLQAIGKK
ncbi:TolC family outer membrane protein [Defluviimonas sp. WL0002]|uniref:TolC family outer membrane protein n=1 Tax=Albidovulum marisflavi TaxID=2984159 RepID=A0ABT2ZED0_9RHOB|nr:TolC family outer membrane protein [Defluviimonas sp. WL0002]MCV2869464.1 TolC family outer membrane protein [Defluviimonas sp. WL0002]